MLKTIWHSVTLGCQCLWDRVASHPNRHAFRVETSERKGMCMEAYCHRFAGYAASFQQFLRLPVLFCFSFGEISSCSIGINFALWPQVSLLDAHRIVYILSRPLACTHYPSKISPPLPGMRLLFGSPFWMLSGHGSMDIETPRTTAL